MASFFMEKRPNGFKPVDDDGLAALARIKNGKLVLVDPKGTRNPGQHRLFWKLMSIIWEHQERYTTKDQLADAIKIAVGWCDDIPRIDGGMSQVPRSISYGNMEQADFDIFFNKVLDLVTTKIIPNTNVKELRDELRRLTGEAV